MLKKIFKFFILFSILYLNSCAKRGNITGGLKDTIAPTLKSSFPKNFSTKFNGKEIKLTFDEFIKLKNLNKQLIVSPPMKNAPSIYPNGVTKIINIKIIDTLQANTTYSFNFGQSIADNNEENPLNQFKYVFSTGPSIDSLSLSGTVKDAYNKDVESFVSVMLYDVNNTFKDSVIYKQSPRYITNTLDSMKTFKLENLKAGKYLLVALKDYNNNNKFNSKKEKIGFRKAFITLPNDSLQELKIFSEIPKFKTYKPIQSSANRLVLPYEGKAKEYKISIKKGDSILPILVTKFPKKDSLQLWFKPSKPDSLSVAIEQNQYKKNYSIKLKKQKTDSLSISPIQNGILDLNDQYVLKSNTPLIRFDNSKIKVTKKDSLAVSFTSHYDDFNQELKIDFKKKPSETYTFELLPNAVVDFFEKPNDTLKFSINTKSLEEYGNLNVSLQNIKHFPVILELTDDKGMVIQSQYSENDTKIPFSYLDPGLFTLRIIYDTNKNKVWDTGNYLEKIQPEEVVYLPKPIDVRANWDVEQIFDVSIPYFEEPKKKEPKKNKPKSGF